MKLIVFVNINDNYHKLPMFYVADELSKKEHEVNGSHRTVATQEPTQGPLCRIKKKKVLTIMTGRFTSLNSIMAAY